MPLTEWELSAAIADWINQIIGKRRTLPFSKARWEQRPDSAPEKCVLTLLGGLGQILVTGEVKFPFPGNGSSPFDAAFVDTARVKACKVSSRHFFTWNVNECVLWETTPNRAPCWEERIYASWEVAEVLRECDMDREESSELLKNWLRVFLGDLAKIVTGIACIRKKPIDEKFADVIKSSLRIPILLTSEELEKKCGNDGFKSELDAWLMDDRHAITADPGGETRGLLGRAARIACWEVAKRLAVHETLLGGRGGETDRISVPEYIDSGEALHNHVEGYFADAIGIAGDHETLFSGDHAATGNRIAFCSDPAVPCWRELIGQIHGFNLPGLKNSEVRRIFERLMSPVELDASGWLNARMDAVDADASASMQREGVPGTDSEEETGGGEKTKRRRVARSEEITTQVLEELKAAHPEMFRRYDPDFLDRRKPFDTLRLPVEGDPETYRDLFKEQGVLFKKGKRQIAFIETQNPAQDNLIVQVARAGIRGYVRFPREENECVRVLDLFSGFAAKQLQTVGELIEKKTDSSQMREKVCSAVMRLIAARN